MAGGRGERLRPITSTRPKPMLEVMNKPIIRHWVDKLTSVKEVDGIIVTCKYKPEVIQEELGKEVNGVPIMYSIESRAMGTAGGVKQAEELLVNGEAFLIVSGDTVTDFDFKGEMEFHRKSKADFTISLIEVENPWDFGICLIKGGGKIYKYLEKPDRGEAFSNTANAGIYVCEPEVLELIPENREFDFSYGLFPLMLGKGMKVYGYVDRKCYWFDIGRPEAYLEANQYLLDNAKPKVPEHVNCTIRGSVYIADGASIHESSMVEGPCVIGNAKIGRNCIVSKSIIYDDVSLGNYVRMDKSVVCEGAEIDENTTLETGVVIGDRTRVGKNVFLGKGVKIEHDNEIVDGSFIFTCLR